MAAQATVIGGIAETVMDPLRVLPFGTCLIHDPINNLGNRGIVFPVWRQIKNTVQYAHYPNECIQLVRYLRGELSISMPFRRMVFHFDRPTFDPQAGQGAAVDTADVVLVEMCAPLNITLGEYFLHRNRLPELIFPYCKQIDPELGKIASLWFHRGICSNNEASRKEYADVLLGRLPAPTDEDEETIRTVIKDARTYASEDQEITQEMDTLATMLDKPMGLLTHTIRYMPDGRPVSWPSNWGKRIFDIAERLGLPVIDPSQYIVRYGADVALSADLSHFKPEFIPTLADNLIEFINAVPTQGPKRRRLSGPAQEDIGVGASIPQTVLNR